MALSLVVPIFGPPAAGKTTLTMRLGSSPGRCIFRLREHVPKEVLAATATSSERLGWIDEFTVDEALRAYFTTAHDDSSVHTVLLDNFPGSASQVGQLLTMLWSLTPSPHIEVIEVITDAKTLKQRAKNRKVCHRCERDPIHDPRLPAVASADDPWQCAHCGGLLHPRRGDSPRLFKARLQRYQPDSRRHPVRVCRFRHHRYPARYHQHHRRGSGVACPAAYFTEFIIMTTVPLPLPTLRSDGYGHARMPRGATVPEPERIDRIAYGRFRNVYLYITEACQLRCEHCYMGERLDRALKMPLPKIVDTLTTWRRLGGSKLTILGGEPTLHPHYCEVIRLSKQLGYEHVITTTNAQKPALRRFRQLSPEDFAYVQVSLDGGSRETHDSVRGAGTFDQAMETTRELTERGLTPGLSAR